MPRSRSADSLRGQQKELGRAVSKASADERPALLERAKHLADEVKAAEVEQDETDAALREAHLAIANLVEDGVPPGGEADFVTLETVGTPPVIAIRASTPSSGLRWGRSTPSAARRCRARGSTSSPASARSSSSRWSTTRWRKPIAPGFTPVIAPALVRPEIMEGTGFLGAHASEVYRLADDDLYLVGTSEVALAGYHSNEILDRIAFALRRILLLLPSRGRLVRQGHQGHHPGALVRQGRDVLLRPGRRIACRARALLAWEREFIDSLELSYRVIDVAAGDLGTSAARKFDIEAWFPSQGTYRELTSTSNCTTFQARRLNIRTRGERGNEPVATLNGTLCAVARTIACLLDHHQQPDGSVYVPAALRPYLGGRELLTA